MSQDEKSERERPDVTDMVKYAIGVPLPAHMRASELREVYAQNVLSNVDAYSPFNAKNLIEYERAAHHKTTELLIERDRKCQQLQEDLRVLWNQVHQRQQEMEWVHHRGLAINDVFDLFVPIVRHLFGATNSAKVHADCKAALAAYEALHADIPDPAYDRAPMGQGVRHLADCQGERAGGVAGVQLPGEAAGETDRAGPVDSFFDDILQSGGFESAYIEWDRDGIQHPNFWLDPATTRRLTFEAKSYVGSRQECLDFAAQFALDMHSGKQALLWRDLPSLDSKISFKTGMAQYRFYCRYGSIPEAEALKIKGIAWRRTVDILQQ